MSGMGRVTAVFYKQIKDTLKNGQILLLFLIYPAVAFAMQAAIGDAMENGVFFTSIFATMHGVFTPIVVTSTIISEEKEKNTLRDLIMANVSMGEYLLSVGGFIFLLTLLTGGLFPLMAGMPLFASLKLMMCIAAGSLCSILLGMAIGCAAKSMTAATGLSVPAGMLFGFMPMMSAFNETIRKFADFTYSEQIRRIISGTASISLKGTLVIICNGLVFALLFKLAYARGRRAE